jgi:hypothetical protein
VPAVRLYSIGNCQLLIVNCQFNAAIPLDRFHRWGSTDVVPAPLAINNPSDAHAYAPASGVLFNSGGASYLDVNQGGADDCWLVASIAEVAARNNCDIGSMFTYVGQTFDSGYLVPVYNVRLYDSSGTAHYITVNTMLPGGGAVYDHPANGTYWAAPLHALPRLESFAVSLAVEGGEQPLP